MNAKNNLCVSTQEDIAWGRSLSLENQNHVISCHACSSVALAFEEIDSVVNNTAIIIPEDFADKIMKKIMAQQTEPTFQENLNEILSLLFNHQLFRWGVGGTSFLIAFAAH